MSEVATNFQQQAGMDDCMAGNPPSSDNEHYLNGYADQYALEQMLTNNSTGVWDGFNS